MRTCRGRVSVPLWLTDLSVQLPVIALVGFYPTNKLIGRRPLPLRTVMCFVLTKTYSINPAFAGVFYTEGYVPTHYSPVRRCPQDRTFNNLQFTFNKKIKKRLIF